ncbi:hypothetical protein K0M31_016380 [Melipona bicolor]|uniref:Uncharacterized protein n=1 Tax=Melipona bicolor TaxID=60889 RepID=A0AA40G7Q4_9HYME|nr:hypothetical protein K0M31_016380 [Melipona bicolor]
MKLALRGCSKEPWLDIERLPQINAPWAPSSSRAWHTATELPASFFVTTNVTHLMDAGIRASTPVDPVSPPLNVRFQRFKFMNHRSKFVA